MFLYTVLIGLAAYKVVQSLQSFIPRKPAPWIKHVLSISLSLLASIQLHIEDPWLVALAAAAVASGWHTLMRFVYIAGTVMRNNPRKR
jgi:hypothetical protein